MERNAKINQNLSESTTITFNDDEFVPDQRLLLNWILPCRQAEKAI